MTAPLTHDAIAERALVERYVARTLADDEAAAFEAHYLTCARCQADVRLAAALRAELPAASAPRRSAWTAAGLLAAAVLAGVLLLNTRRPAAELQRLGQVGEPPVYLGVPVRAAPAPGDSAFDVAMLAYAARRFEPAASGLGAALAAGADSAPAEFFRAASLLMLRRDREAADGFRRVIALGATPYAGEAHYYLAKSLLRLGHADDAVAELRLVPATPPGLRATAAALADSARAATR